jgi:hypothetical protein
MSRFDERGEETERCGMAQATAPLLDSTNVFVSSRSARATDTAASFCAHGMLDQQLLLRNEYLVAENRHLEGAIAEAPGPLGCRAGLPDTILVCGRSPCRSMSLDLSACTNSFPRVLQDSTAPALAEGLWRYFPERTTTRHYQIYGRGDWPLGGVRLQEISALRIGCPRCPPHCVMGRSAAPPEKDTGHYARLFELPGSFP